MRKPDQEGIYVSRIFPRQYWRWTCPYCGEESDDGMRPKSLVEAVYNSHLRTCPTLEPEPVTDPWGEPDEGKFLVITAVDPPTRHAARTRTTKAMGCGQDLGRSGAKEVYSKGQTDDPSKITCGPCSKTVSRLADHPAPDSEADGE